MTDSLTTNTQAILLLTAPLLGGGKGESAPLLSAGEYNRLARLLRDRQRQPGELLGADETLDLCASLFERERLRSLLNRGFLLSQTVQRWSSRAIWVLSRADPTYPRRLKALLKEDTPPLLYGCGDVTILDRAAFGVVGSRHVDDALIAYTENIGRLAAPHRMVVSGGAKGIDRAAMSGALQGGGLVAGVLADSLERAALARDNREPLLERRLVLISPYDPAAGFNVGHAMQRNKLIYALADAALVVSSDFEKGGTWAGAVEQLERLRHVPVFVRENTDRRGNAALIKKGGLPWPEPANPRDFETVVSEAVAMFAPSAKSELFPQSVGEAPPDRTDSNAVVAPIETARTTNAPATSSTAHATSPAETLRSTVRALLREELKTERTAEETAERLGIALTQMKTWLNQFAAEGVVEKVQGKKPAHYRIAAQLF